MKKVKVFFQIPINKNQIKHLFKILMKIVQFQNLFNFILLNLLNCFVKYKIILEGIKFFFFILFFRIYLNLSF